MTAPASGGRPARPPTRLEALPFGTVLSTGLAVGVAGDLLMRGPGGPGLNLLLLFVLSALAVRGVTRRAGRSLSREAGVWLVVGTAFAAGIVLRAAPALQLLAFFAAALAFALPALRAGAGWVRRSGVGDQMEAVAGAVAWSALGALRLAGDRLSRRGAPEEAVGGGRGVVTAVLRGFLLAAPFLVVFGALFMSADRVFRGLVLDLVRVDLEAVASHVMVTGVLTWLACGYLTGFLTGTRSRHIVESRIRRPGVGIVEVGVALWLVDLLFVAFVAVQFRYLFGGSGLVEVTPGLTYAEYAREGFVQLAVASAIVLPALLGSDWLLRREGRRDERIFRVLGGVQLLLLMVVIASALQRVRAYQEAYGLTGSRFYGAAFLGWLTLLTVWFGATVLRGRRDRFAFPVLVSGFAVVAVLFAANPDVWIARTNLARTDAARPGAPSSVPTAQERPGGADQAAGRSSVGSGYSASPEAVVVVDAAYLASLGADAVPTLVRAVPSLSAEARCTLARGLLGRWGTQRRTDWRSWNRSVERARRVVREEASRLRRMTGADGDCPEPDGA